MAASSSSKDKFFDNVINPYLWEVMQHPQAIQMRDGVMHIHDVQGPKGNGSMEARLEAMEKEVFRCKGMVERGLNANNLMIADYTRDLKVNGKSMRTSSSPSTSKSTSSIAISTNIKAKSLNKRQGLKV
ncbi:40S ribosomal protein S5-1 [Hordeum vulgare]|nr:40S ribosomal protein S5-1 [Hordeum vulgare]